MALAEAPTFVRREGKKPLIGREEYGIYYRLTPGIVLAHANLRKHFTDGVADAVSFKLHQNSAVEYREELGSNRPASAYFTLLNGKLIIEWGEIDPFGDARLHDYLNRNIDFLARRGQGGVVRSGHIGIIRLGDNLVRCALIDSLIPKKPLIPASEEFTFFTTLTYNNILLLDAKGIPVNIRPM